MKKKILLSVILVVLMTFGISTVYADVVIPGERFYAYDDVEKVEVFFEWVGLPLIVFLVILTISVFLLGLIILSIYLINDKKNEKDNKKSYLPILKKFYLVLILILNFVQLQIIRITLIFHSNFTGVRTMRGIRASNINKIMLTICIIYTLIIILTGVFLCIKKKSTKVIYIFTTIITIILFEMFVGCAYLVSDTNAGYYYYDGNYLYFE